MSDQHIIDENQGTSFAEVVKFPILQLTNTPTDTFWWKNGKFEERFDHEKARVGSRFVDGNNGDRWRVIAADVKHKRLIVQNLSQNPDSPFIVFWD